MIEIIPNWHPILVHYTVALLSISAILFLVAFCFPRLSYRDTLLTTARVNLWLGAAITLVTIMTGFYAFDTVAHDDVSHHAMVNHRDWALHTAVAFLALALWQMTRVSQQRYRALFLMLILGATAALVVTAYKGGELVYRYGVGVMALPSSEPPSSNASAPRSSSHQHHHGGHHAH